MGRDTGQRSGCEKGPGHICSMPSLVEARPSQGLAEVGRVGAGLQALIKSVN